MESGQYKTSAALVLSFTLMGVAVILAFTKEDAAAIVTVVAASVLLIGVFVHILRLQQRWKHTPGHTYGDMVIPRTPQSRQTHVPL
jgi:hypothetical protein